MIKFKQMTLKRQLVLLVCVLFALHAVFNLLFFAITGEAPYVSGDLVKVSPATSEDVFWGRFYAFGAGTFESTNPENAELNSLALPWSVVARDLPFGVWEEIRKLQSDPQMGKGIINANVQIPDIEVSKRTVVEGHIVINGYVPRPVGEGYFEKVTTQMTSELVSIVLYPASMTWLVTQSHWTSFSILGVFITGLLLTWRSKGANPNKREVS